MAQLFGPLLVILLSFGANSGTSTLGGGSGFTVIYGVAAAVKTPLMGPARKP